MVHACFSMNETLKNPRPFSLIFNILTKVLLFLTFIIIPIASRTAALPYGQKPLKQDQSTLWSLSASKTLKCNAMLSKF